MRTVVVVPAFNEQDSVGEVVKRVLAGGMGVIVVDDGSSDLTAVEAESAGARVLRLPVNIGVGGALRTGFAYAVRRGFERVIQVDGDLQHDPALIPVLVEAADQTGAELVIGSRFGSGSYPVSRGRRTLMRALARLVSRTVGTDLDDVTSGFRVISQPLLQRFAADYPTEYLGDTVEAILLAHKHGATVAQVPVEMAPRASGSPVSRLDAGRHLARVLFSMAVRSWGRSPS